MSAALGTSAKRIARELKDATIPGNLPVGCKCSPKCDADPYNWTASLIGPPDSVYDGGCFEFDILLPKDYPFHPPGVRCLTRVFHPNINAQGGICLDILKHAWSPALSIVKVLLSISSLLTDPNPSDPLVPEIAQMYLRDRKKFDRTAKEWTAKYAMPKVAAVLETKPAPKPSTPSRLNVIELD